MSATEWLVRTARSSDQKLLAAFSCAASGVRWETEVETFIRGTILRWAHDPNAKAQDPRLLLLFQRRPREFVGLAAHERTKLLANNADIFDATKLEVVAIARDWQGRRFRGGARASDVLMSAVMTDISARVPPRDARVFAVVHEKNVRSIELCRRHGLVEELSRPAPDYRRLITGRK